jgi:beta-phosphoglucomutase
LTAGSKPRIQAVVFDFDGVLANSEPLHLRAYEVVLGEAGSSISRRDYYQHYLGFDDVGVFRAISEARGHGWTEAQIAALVVRKTSVFEEMVASGDLLYPRAIDCVSRLAERYPLGIASGALRHEIEHVLHSSRLDRYIRFIVASGDTPLSKPAPDPYRRAAELHGLPAAACVAIEDSRWGIDSARAAGMRTVGITHTYAAAEIGNADVVIDSLDQFTASLIDSLP